MQDIKSVLGILPFGSVTVPTADFLFKSLGWSETVVPSVAAGKALTQMDVKIYGLSGVFKIQP